MHFFTEKAEIINKYLLKEHNIETSFIEIKTTGAVQLDCPSCFCTSGDIVEIRVNSPLESSLNNLNF